MRPIASMRLMRWALLMVPGLCLVSMKGVCAETLPVYGLEELIKLALERSPELREAEQDIAIAESELSQAKAAQWAQLDAAGFAGITDEAEKPVVKITRKVRRRPAGLWIADIEEGLEDTEASDIGPFGRLTFTIVQPLYTFGKIVKRKKAAYHGVKAQQVAMEKTKGELIRRVKELYFALILAGQGKESAQEAESFVDDARRRIKRLLELGATTVDESDLYRLEAYAAESKQFRAKADTGARLAYVALQRTVGLSPEENFRLDLDELPKDTRALGDQREYIEKALKHRPEFDRLDHGLEAKKHLIEAAKADMYPSFFAMAVGDYAGAPNRAHLAEPYIGDDYNTAGVGAVLGASWHFDLGILQGEVRKAKAEYRRLVNTKGLAERDIPIEVARFYQDAEEAKASFQAYEKAAAATRKWIVVSFSNFDMGIGSAKDMFLAIERFGKNQGEYLSSLLDYHIALANLSFSIGEYRMED